jgi:hypothetical protein
MAGWEPINRLKLERSWFICTAIEMIVKVAVLRASHKIFFSLTGKFE